MKSVAVTAKSDTGVWGTHGNVDFGINVHEVFPFRTDLQFLVLVRARESNVPPRPFFFSRPYLDEDFCLPHGAHDFTNMRARLL